jgi:peptidoglycan/LPS O-acetylase OafA/YrhL
MILIFINSSIHKYLKLTSLIGMYAYEIYLTHAFILPIIKPKQLFVGRMAAFLLIVIISSWSLKVVSNRLQYKMVT